MQTIYILTTYIYICRYICSQENKQTSRNSRLFFLFLHLVVNYSNYINFIKIRFRTFYSCIVCGLSLSFENNKFASTKQRHEKQKNKRRKPADS